MKTTVLYHSADYDGIFCREIARKFLPDAELIGWNFGEPPVLIDAEQDYESKVYILDLPVDEPLGFKFGMEPVPKIDLTQITWIDHHGSSIGSHPEEIPGYRIDGVAACRLAWQWFIAVERLNQQGSQKPEWITKYPFPEKREYVDRNVLEPIAVRLAGEYDIWDKRDSNAELFQMGLRSQSLDSLWEVLLQNPSEEIAGKLGLDEITVGALLDAGKALQYAKTHENESIIKAAGFTIEFEGLKFLACNHARYNSFLFTAGLTPEHDACFGFAWRNGTWNVSLYHAPGKEHHDLSKIAVKHGGGGHKGACGFTTKSLPFLNT